MLEPHPPHHTPDTWRDFILHIATIVVGLLIAVGIEQTVEALHHHHLAQELREQMHAVFEHNLELEPVALEHQAAFRGYLAEQRNAVQARLAGHPLPAEPDRNDARMRYVSSTPSLAPYDVAIQNGSIAYLKSNEIALYNRVAKQREYLNMAINEWFRAVFALESFEKQFTNAHGDLEIGQAIPAPDLASLSTAELTEYRKLLADTIDATDRMGTRTIRIDTMGRAILDGATEEDQLLQAIHKRVADEPEPAHDARQR